MGAINWAELFPGRWSPVIFVSYMALFVNQGIIVTWSQRKGHYEYNIVTVVLMTEVVKLIVSIVLYCREHKVVQLFQETVKHRKVLLQRLLKQHGNMNIQTFFLHVVVLLLYMIPSFLYCLYNNLAFVNLAAFDPTTYYVLLQFRVVITGIIFQVIFKKQLSTKQWMSLVILTLGCMIKHISLDTNSTDLGTKISLSSNIIFIFIQTICSCLAGVYNEYLLKGQGANINIFVQNVFMYIDSIVCNGVVFVLLFIAQSNVINVFEDRGPSIFTQPKVLLIMINNTAIGIITSFFLKNLNSILKTFASALELVFTAILCWMIFDIPVYMNTVISIAMVSYAVILYSQNPVQNAQPKDTTSPENSRMLNV